MQRLNESVSLPGARASKAMAAPSRCDRRRPRVLPRRRHIRQDNAAARFQRGLHPRQRARATRRVALQQPAPAPRPALHHGLRGRRVGGGQRPWAAGAGVRARRRLPRRVGRPRPARTRVSGHQERYRHHLQLQVKIFFLLFLAFLLKGGARASFSYCFKRMCLKLVSITKFCQLVKNVEGHKKKMCIDIKFYL